MNKLKNESKKRMEGSSKFSKEYEVRNDKIDKTIGKPKIVRDTCEFAILIENPHELIKTTDDNCESIDILLHDIKNLNDKFDKLGKRSKKGINKFKNFLKSYEVINDNANILIEKLQSIKTNGIG